MNFFVRRLLFVIPTLIAVSFISFLVINLPPGDFVDHLAAQAARTGDLMTPDEKTALRHTYGLDQPVPVQYVRWVAGIVLHGDFGYSFTWKLPVAELIWQKLGLTALLSIFSLTVIWIIAIPIGIYSAVRRYSLADYTFTVFGFLGLAVPNFLLALAVMYIVFVYFGQDVGGLFSEAYVDAPWSWDKAVDLAGHIWLPTLVLAASGTASVIRIIRANLIDELHKPYVMAGRAKGLPEFRLLMKYPVRHALNPFVSGLNDILVDIVSGSTIVSIVMGLQTTGPLLLRALRDEDSYMAAGFILMLSVLTVVGTLLSDLLLGWLDPRIRRQWG
ncbi:MAG TPA: ABC transporter permease [Devosia sp.]|jgi:peptide/nickel transport system permease protein|nr:ABC transporter permease [Devosia sp.]